MVMKKRFIRSYLIGAIFAGASAVAAAPRAVLLDMEHATESIRLAGLTDQTLRYFDHQNTLQTRELSQIVQLRFEHQLPEAKTAQVDSRIELTDGQRLVGRWVGAVNGGQALRFEHALLGTTQINIEAISSLRLAAGSDFGSPSSNDRVVLNNGDQMDGLVLALGDQHVEFQPAGADQSIQLPLERIKAMRLSNEPAPRALDHHVIHLVDGSIIRAHELAIDSQTLSMRIALPGQLGAPRTIDLAYAARLDFSAAGRRLVNLLDQPFRILAGGQVFGRRTAPRLTDQALHLHAPITLAFTLPKGAARFAAVAELDVDDAALADSGSIQWADFKLIVRDVTGSIASHYFDEHHRAASINVVITGEQLILELDQQANGPIMDRLRISHAVILTVQENQ